MRLTLRMLLALFVAFNALMVLMNISEITMVATGDISQYPFGWEGGGIVYRTPAHYMLFCGLHMLVSGFVVVASFLKRRRVVLVAVLCALAYYTVDYALNPVYQ